MKKPFIPVLIILFSSLIFWRIASHTAPKNPMGKTVLLDEQNDKIPFSSFSGQVVIVSFFKTWCRDCRKEQPELLHLQQAVGKDRLKIIFVTDESFDKINQMKNYVQLDLTVYRSEKPLKEIGIHRFSTTYLLDKKGKVEEAKVEGIHWNTKEMQEKILKLNE